MSRRRNNLTQVQQRLLDLFGEIEDEDIRMVIVDVITVERQYRSSSRQNFPMRKVRDAVDAVARRQEIEE